MRAGNLRLVRMRAGNSKLAGRQTASGAKSDGRRRPWTWSVLAKIQQLGNPITMALGGNSMRIAPGEIVRYNIESGIKVRRWKNKKEFSGKDVMEILGIALMLTNDPAYAAAREAMIRHRIHTGGLKHGFLKLHRRHHEPPEHCCADSVSWHIKEGYRLREAAEHVAADEGIPGTSFRDAADKVRKAYARREQHEAERQQYLNGYVDVDDSG
jgi:hypothetical protein